MEGVHPEQPDDQRVEEGEDQRHDGDGRQGGQHPVEFPVDAGGEKGPMVQPPLQGVKEGGSAYPGDDRQEHGLGPHVVDAELGKISASQNEEGKERGQHRAGAPRFPIRLLLHVGAADGKGHVNGKHAEGGLVDEFEQLKEKAADRRGEEALISRRRKGLQDQREGPDGENGDHADEAAADDPDQRQVLQLAGKYRRFGFSLHGEIPP